MATFSVGNNCGYEWVKNIDIADISDDKYRHCIDFKNDLPTSTAEHAVLL